MSLFGGPSAAPYVQGAQQTLASGSQYANDLTNFGYDKANTRYEQQANLFGSLADNYAGGSKLYLDASGANEVDAAKAARSAYTASPGYSFNMDQGLQALDRTHAVAGTLASGGADTDAMKFASGLASQDYGNWLSNLSNIDTKEANAVGNRANTYGHAGDLAGQIGLFQGQGALAASQGGAALTMKGLDTAEKNSQQELGGWLGLASLGGNLAGKAFSIFGN